ncbi:MAG: DUF447 family protein [Pirellulales bacterium]
MIIEGLLTSIAADGSPHVAPMGPVVDPELKQWVLRPFQSSTTFGNLRRTNSAVFHVVDDVLPIVQAALNYEHQLQFQRLEDGNWAIASACHWYQLHLDQWNTDRDRAEVSANVIRCEVLRPFWGWNRAKHAVLEATILATRVHMTGKDVIVAELEKMNSAVNKTAGPRELKAWQLIHDYLDNWKTDRNDD